MSSRRMLATQIDVYAVLGITPDASPALAREMYWRKVQHLLAEGDQVNRREELDALNEALTVVLDEQLRLEYDAQRRTAEGGPAMAQRPGRHSNVRPGLLAVGALLTALAAIMSWQAAIAAGVLTLAGSALAFWPRSARQAANAFATLHLPDEASSEEIEVAYRALAEALLITVRRDRHAIAALDALDRAYLSAMRATLARDAGPPRRTGRVRRQLGARRFALRAVAAILAALELLMRVVFQRVRAIRSTVNERSERREAEIALAEQESRNAVNRRLSAALSATATQVVRGSTDESAARNSADKSVRPAFLLLDSAAGTRRVAIDSRPVTIGSAPSCDLVLPELPGAASEHVLVWRHGSQVILHAALDANCAVNGEPVTWSLLDEGDTLQVGTHTLRVSIPAEEPASIA